MTRKELEAENDSIAKQIANITSNIVSLQNERDELIETRLANMAEINRLLQEELNAA